MVKAGYNEVADWWLLGGQVVGGGEREWERKRLWGEGVRGCEGILGGWLGMCGEIGEVGSGKVRWRGDRGEEWGKGDELFGVQVGFWYGGDVRNGEGVVLWSESVRKMV
ncbi:unnamed protein product [Moneuplotes crassus]|uniref:Uncharacterized protein n=1 Tax=Euplotes crassus TaxID=5936 RepID=A0AAD1X6S8_EUPCR|nr:unnamed protein product [Moneuplotes crassus]